MLVGHCRGGRRLLQWCLVVFGPALGFLSHSVPSKLGLRSGFCHHQNQATSGRGHSHKLTASLWLTDYLQWASLDKLHLCKLRWTVSDDVLIYSFWQSRVESWLPLLAKDLCAVTCSVIHTLKCMEGKKHPLDQLLPPLLSVPPHWYLLSFNVFCALQIVKGLF